MEQHLILDNNNMNNNMNINYDNTTDNTISDDISNLITPINLTKLINKKIMEISNNNITLKYKICTDEQNIINYFNENQPTNITTLHERPHMFFVVSIGTYYFRLLIPNMITSILNIKNCDIFYDSNENSFNIKVNAKSIPIVGIFDANKTNSDMNKIKFNNHIILIGDKIELDINEQHFNIINNILNVTIPKGIRGFDIVENIDINNFKSFTKFEVNMDEKIKARVQFVFIGESPAVKADGGVLVRAMQEIEIEALPKDLPKEIMIDISSLATFEDKIHIKDLKLSGGIRILTNLNETIALVAPPRSDKEMEELETKPFEAAVSEVKVVGEEAKAAAAAETGQEEAK